VNALRVLHVTGSVCPKIEALRSVMRMKAFDELQAEG
jgi:hypothetical protein